MIPDPVGENVATAPTLEMNHKGLLNSPPHYKNIMGDWDEIGIGIAAEETGQLYVTQLFTNPAGTAVHRRMRFKISRI